MMKSTGRIAAMLLMASVAMPFSANAQVPDPKKEPPKAAPAKPAAPAPAARPAPPPPAAARPAPPPAAARPAAPPPAARVAPPRPQAPAAVAPQRPAPRRAATPENRQPPAAARSVPQQQRIQERAQRRNNNDVQQRRQAQPVPAATPQLRQQVQTPAPAAANPRQVQRQERALRLKEDRALRNVPPQQRAQRREEFQRAREQRALQRNQVQPSVRQAQPNALQAQPNARVRTGARLNGQARVTPQAARQGRFASRFALAQSANALTANAGTALARGGRFSARQAWRQGLRAAFVPWYGPVFWPYAYSDVFDYAFWPSGYDDGYFAYVYDDFLDGVFFGEAGAPEEYVGSTAYVAAPRAAPTYAAVQQLCAQPGSGITAWPFAEIEQKVGLNAEQKQLLGDVRTAGNQASSAFKASCPTENAFPLTPPGRLAAMTSRLDATLGAVQTVKPALEKFYDSLSDEQKARFNEIGPKPQVKENATTSQASAGDSKSCQDQKPGLTNLPIESIEDAVKPTQAQADRLKALEDATAKAVSIMQAACPDETPITPPGRLEAMEKRLQAMIEAANIVKPALSQFYGALSAEQKARFNRIGGQLAKAD